MKFDYNRYFERRREVCGGEMVVRGTRVEIEQWTESVLLLKKDAEWEPQNANARLFAEMSLHNRSNPLRLATAIASVRLRTFSFLNRDWTWLLTR